MGEDIPTVEPENESRPTIAFRPNSVRQKAEWERAAEQSDEYSNVSHLIRKAVKPELTVTDSTALTRVRVVFALQFPLDRPANRVGDVLGFV